MKRILCAAAVIGCIVPGVAGAQQYAPYGSQYGYGSAPQAQSAGIVGVWRSARQSSYDPQTGIRSSAVFTTALRPDGSFQTQIVSEGGDGIRGAGGIIVISGHYRFDGQVLQWRSETYAVCVAGSCQPQRPNDPKFGTIEQAEFITDGGGRANFLGMTWTRLA